MSFRPLSGYLISKYNAKDKYKSLMSVSVPSRGILFPNNMKKFICTAVTFVSVPSRGILFPNSVSSRCRIIWSFSVSVPSRGILFPNEFDFVVLKAQLKIPSPLGVSYFQILAEIGFKKIEENRFRPLSGYLISKSCPPEPAILLAFLTLLRGKSFSCIFFLYLTYTIASKCSIYAVRGKIIFFLINCCTYLF